MADDVIFWLDINNQDQTKTKGKKEVMNELELFKIAFVQDNSYISEWSGNSNIVKLTRHFDADGNHYSENIICHFEYNDKSLINKIIFQPAELYIYKKTETEN